MPNLKEINGGTIKAVEAKGKVLKSKEIKVRILRSLEWRRAFDSFVLGLNACRSLRGLLIIGKENLQKLFPNCSTTLFVVDDTIDYRALSFKGKLCDFRPSECICWEGQRVKQNKCLIAKNGHGDHYCIPLLAGRGVFHISGKLSLEEKSLAERIALHLQGTVSNILLIQQLYKRATVDMLTGLYNYRCMKEILEREISRMKRHRYNGALLMIDLDHFKSVNDTFGHRTGDFVLQSIGKFLKKKCRKEDFAFRFGGEEFTVFLPDTGEKNALCFAQHLLDGLKKVKIPFGEKRICITFSIGISFFPQSGGTAEELIRVADKALYEAKAAGRNCFRVAGDRVLFFSDFEKALKK